MQTPATGLLNLHTSLGTLKVPVRGQQSLDDAQVEAQAKQLVSMLTATTSYLKSETNHTKLDNRALGNPLPPDQSHEVTAPRATSKLATARPSLSSIREPKHVSPSPLPSLMGVLASSPKSSARIVTSHEGNVKRDAPIVGSHNLPIGTISQPAFTHSQNPQLATVVPSMVGRISFLPPMAVPHGSNNGLRFHSPPISFINSNSSTSTLLATSSLPSLLLASPTISLGSGTASTVLTGAYSSSVAGPLNQRSTISCSKCGMMYAHDECVTTGPSKRICVSCLITAS